MGSCKLPKKLIWSKIKKKILSIEIDKVEITLSQSWDVVLMIINPLHLLDQKWQISASESWSKSSSSPSLIKFKLEFFRQIRVQFENFKLQTCLKSKLNSTWLRPKTVPSISSFEFYVLSFLFQLPLELSNSLV